MNIYVANNDGEWLRRHERFRDIENADWWLHPDTTAFRNASGGDLFFITKTGSRKLFAVATLNDNYRTEHPDLAWEHATIAYRSDLTPRKRAAAVLNVPEDHVSADSKIGLLVLTHLRWFDDAERPSVPDSYSKFVQSGKRYLAGDQDYDYLYNLSVDAANYGAESSAVRDAFKRFSEAQIAEIIPRHRHLAERFSKWLHRNGYGSVRKELGRVDVRFRFGGQTLMAELKVCYEMDTLHAIRDAVGQLLEYNHYSGRNLHDQWWIILDQIPTEADAKYVHDIRVRYGVPIYLGHEVGPECGDFAIDNRDRS